MSRHRTVEYAEGLTEEQIRMLDEDEKELDEGIAEVQALGKGNDDSVYASKNWQAKITPQPMSEDFDDYAG